MELFFSKDFGHLQLYSYSFYIYIQTDNKITGIKRDTGGIYHLISRSCKWDSI